MEIYVIFDEKNNTYQVGGGSSTLPRERFYLELKKASQIRDRYFKNCKIQVFQLLETEE